MSTATAPADAPAAASKSAPPGPAPSGKVWSTEHGHWHDQATTPPPVQLGEVKTTDASGKPLNTFFPQPTSTAPPSGPAPAGKVWSADHKHWHDAPKAGIDPNSVKVLGQPATTPGAVMPTVAAQPPGPAPEGKVWSAQHGHFHDKPTVTMNPPTAAPAPPPAKTGTR